MLWKKGCPAHVMMVLTIKSLGIAEQNKLYRLFLYWFCQFFWWPSRKEIGCKILRKEIYCMIERPRLSQTSENFCENCAGSTEFGLRL